MINFPDPTTQVRIGDLVAVKTPDGRTDVATVVDNTSETMVCLDWPMPLGPVAVWVERELLRCPF